MFPALRDTLRAAARNFWSLVLYIVVGGAHHPSLAMDPFASDDQQLTPSSSSLSSDDPHPSQSTPDTPEDLPSKFWMAGISQIGARSPDQKEFTVATPQEFVRKFGGKKVITRILIANNGIAAVKCMRSIRKWAYEVFRNDHAFHFIGMVTPEDLKAGAEYVKLADTTVWVPGGANNNNYANVKLILDIATRYDADGVWAGWGHASEYPELPAKLHKNGIAFIGPPEKAMWALGDKIASSIVAQTANIPTLPWSGSGLKAEYTESDSGPRLKIPHELYKQGCVETVEEALNAAKKIGFPVMIKASEGGGGKGIRKTESEDNFPALFRQVQAEVPGSPIFIMKLAECARHLEVQIIADVYGNAVSLFGRDCSVQRRHQKIIEEAPCVIANPEVFYKMEQAAVNLAKLVGYVNAGTVEYLYDNDGNFFFLELNPRLQVEHPCTEMITDINLPAAQLQVAMGIPLHRIRCVRVLFGESPWGDSVIDFNQSKNKPVPKGHCIAARITSENPDEGFKPSSGTVQELNFRSSKNVWGYFSVSASGGLHEYADSQFGHCFSWGEDRGAARENLVIALKELSIRGDFRTTVEYLITLLETETFQENSIDTGWLDHLIASQVKGKKPDTMLAVMCASVLIADNTIQDAYNNFHNSLEKGQTLPLKSLNNVVEVDLISDGIKYHVQATKSGPTQYFLVLNATHKCVDFFRMSDGGLLLSVDGVSHVTYLKDEVDKYCLTIGHQTCVFEKENDPTTLRSSAPGKLINYLQEDGSHVFVGQPYAEIESMKMVMALTVTESGCVYHLKRPGAVLSAGDIIARLDLDDSSIVTKAQPFTGGFPTNNTPLPREDEKLNHIYQTRRAILDNVLNGYCLPDDYFTPMVKVTVQKLMSVLRDPNLPLLELQEVIASVSGRIPQAVEKKIRKYMMIYGSNVTSMLAQFPSQEIASAVDSHAASLQKKDRDVFFVTTQGLVQLCQRYKKGSRGRMTQVVQELLKHYLQVETQFQHGSYDKCVHALREKYKEDVTSVLATLVSHSQVAKKNKMVILLIEHLCGHEPGLTDDLSLILEQLTKLNSTEHSRVALRARQVLIAAHQPAYELRYNQMESIFLPAIDMYGHSFHPENLQKLILSETSIFDVLHAFFYHTNMAVRMASLEVYVRRAYISYELPCLRHKELAGGVSVVFFKFLLPSSHPNRIPHNKMWTTLEYTDPHHTPIDPPANLENCQRMGIMAAFKNFEDFEIYFSDLMNFFQPSDLGGLEGEMSPQEVLSGSIKLGSSFKDFMCEPQEVKDPIHIMNIGIRMEEEDDSQLSEQFAVFCASKKVAFHEAGIRRITMVVFYKQQFPRYFTYRSRDEFQEDRIYRHLEPALAFQLEINRLRTYDLEALPTSNRKMHLYLAKAKVADGQEVTDFRFFIRSIIRHSDLITKEASFEYLEKEGEKLLLEAMDELEVAFSHPLAKRTDCNHVFLNFVPTVIMNPSKIEDSIRSIVNRYGRRLWSLRVLQAEIKMTIRQTPQSKTIPIRLTLSNESGYYLDMHLYREVTDKLTGQVKFSEYKIDAPHRSPCQIASLNTWRRYPSPARGVFTIKFEGFGIRQGPLHGLPISTPYMTKDYLQLKRFQAQTNGTTYVYDFPEMFRQALERVWEEHLLERGGGSVPSHLMNLVELVLDQDDQLVEEKRLPGENNIGMVAWRMTLHTPEYPEGRDIIIICNDITYQIGSFGPREDILFLRASQFARLHKIPRLYIAANSGARIGLAEEIKHMFKVAWEDPSEPDKGFKYLYLAPEDYKKVSTLDSIHAELIDDNGEARYKINDIIGKEDGLGVENLQHSGMIAGETSQAYREVVTYSMVTCRAIGIGAYLVRLGQRVVQVESSHIILTGFSALNKLLGREVYSSNSQLGGVQIMHKNGISHDVAPNDLEGIYIMLRWLSYVPKTKDSPLPILEPVDPVEREVTFMPSRASYDPRWLVNGRPSPSNPNEWESGFFDKNSFQEILEPWAQTVMCGRARLGGIPVGVICVETRTVEFNLLADPANLDSEAKTVSQAGQVWFPDSAYKTSQAIKDFNHEGLPLLIFANWRGFSGGMKDMYEQVIKFGAYIVDALREYNQPILVYVPPYAELRGGAWVVIDSSINERYMEMYADPLSRGGVLEPEGTVEIKFKKKDIVKSMSRLDPIIHSLNERLSVPDLPPEKEADLRKKIQEREDLLMPTYHQLAVTFADLHDTPVRMQEKGVIQGVVPWAQSRKVLFWRLRRLLAEERVKKEIRAVQSDSSDGQIDAMLRRWFFEEKGSVESYLWDKDKVVAEWLDQQMESYWLREDGKPCLEESSNSYVLENLQQMKRDAAISQVMGVVKFSFQEFPEIAMDTIVHIIRRMSPSQRADTLKALNNMDLINQQAEPITTPDQQDNSN
ncbi:acetyl-CoA carboxylase isoform X3 [Procambarus clarkii]|uniref:acetyl-CoA carboxylase isoform X3 n=1 Tax=Procambarus clarkii TaxID=6728 RepID=UPI0037426F42